MHASGLKQRRESAFPRQDALLSIWDMCGGQCASIAAFTPVRAGGSATIPLRVLNTGNLVVQIDVFTGCCSTRGRPTRSPTYRSSPGLRRPVVRTILPSPIVELSADRAFVTLVWKVGEAEQRLDLLRRLRERPVAVKVVPPSPLVLVCHLCLSENTMGSALCRRCGRALLGGVSLGALPGAASAHVAPGTDQSLLGRFVVLHDRFQTQQVLAEALAVRGATVAVTDTLRSTRAALAAHPDVTALVSISRAVVAEPATGRAQGAPGRGRAPGAQLLGQVACRGLGPHAARARQRPLGAGPARPLRRDDRGFTGQDSRRPKPSPAASTSGLRPRARPAVGDGPEGLEGCYADSNHGFRRS